MLGSPQLAQAARFGAVTLSWLARRMLRLERLVRRFGRATVSLLLVIRLQAEQRRESRIDARFFAAVALTCGRVRGGGVNTRAVLRAQGDHRDFEDELVPEKL